MVTVSYLAWLAGAYFFTNIFPKMVDAWQDEMRSLEREDYKEYELFQKNLAEFFTQHQNKNSNDGFERI